MSYTVQCCSATNLGSEFYTFPTGCRVSGGSLTRRENLVHIPYADGTKDTADGTLEGGDVTVSGRIWGADATVTISWVLIMEAVLLERSSAFYVCQEYSGAAKYYPVHGCKSVAHTLVEGAGGIWIDISCVFSRGPDPAMET